MTAKPGLREMMRAQEAADYLGVHVKTLHRWSDAGKIRVYRTPGKQRRYYKADLDLAVKSMLQTNEEK